MSIYQRKHFGLLLDSPTMQALIKSFQEAEEMVESTKNNVPKVIKKGTLFRSLVKISMMRSRNVILNISNDIRVISHYYQM